jgi:hypothetical protein
LGDTGGHMFLNLLLLSLESEIMKENIFSDLINTLTLSIKRVELIFIFLFFAHEFKKVQLFQKTYLVKFETYVSNIYFGSVIG